MSELAGTSVLAATGLQKSYQSGHRQIEVLQGVSLSIEAGETISIRGESGSGKSTLLNLLAGIEMPDAGDVSWNGQLLSGLPESRRPKKRSEFLGFVFQSFYLIPELNLLENVLIAARIAGLSMKEARSRAFQLLEELGLQDRLESRPEQLSGGERQRTAIARALINQPKILLADEPTGNLDEHTAERVIDQLLTVVDRHRAALVLVTHHPGFAARAQKQYRLVDGNLA
ncbi:ABC transporter ATP-binding protein [Puniceicoccales bacterium CK1056]|uniref:ABC transporter ATP-binding protein n=1 Tax=Oceanipulchritudo coccoides TaxID=2706888 RepID=A0A6B2LZD4_9BACT|nr:ABC transporter ATP-binding protein [Oceanipulchritudo coccoides]NDV61522.1 ABC transporter ATP-binding protein [Oceanipulchritudo coccoides]